MIEQQGRVIAVENGRARVRLGGRTGCAACDAGRGCGAGVFGRLLRRRKVDLEFDNFLGAVGGEPVMVGVPERWFLVLVGRFYLLPVLAGLGGATFGHYLGSMAGFNSATVDATTLLAAVAVGAVAVWRNRVWSAEFSRAAAVQLLRMVDGPEPNQDQEEIS